MHQERTQTQDEQHIDGYHRVEASQGRIRKALTRVARGRVSNQIAAVIALLVVTVLFSCQYQISSMKSGVEEYKARIMLLESQLSTKEQSITSLNENQSIEDLAAAMRKAKADKRKAFFLSKNDDDIQKTVKALDSKLGSKVDAEIKKLDALLEAKIKATSQQVDTNLNAQILNKTSALDTALQAKIAAAGNALDSKLEEQISHDELRAANDTASLKFAQHKFKNSVLKAKSDLEANDVVLDKRIKSNEASVTVMNGQFGNLQNDFKAVHANAHDKIQEFRQLRTDFTNYKVDEEAQQFTQRKAVAQNLVEVKTQLTSQIAELQQGFQTSLAKMNAEASLAAAQSQAREMEALQLAMEKQTNEQLSEQRAELDNKIGGIEMSINGQFMLCSGDKEECKCKAGNTVRAVFLDQYGYFKSVNQVFKKDAVQCNSEEFGVTSDTDLQFSCYCRLNTAAKWGK